ncbi:MAG: hypothetical protein AB7H97_20030, partial [Pseudobdellovibrionaceae bacterium]
MRIESRHSALAYFPDFDGFWQPHDWASSEKQIRAQLPTHWATEWTPHSVEILTQLARAHGLMGDLLNAQATLSQAQQMLSSSKVDMGSRAEVRWLLEQGRVHYLGMSPIKAHDLFVQAWTLASENGLHFFAVDAALMLSTVRPPKFQNEWLQKALILAEASSDEKVRLWLTHLLFLEGWHAFDFRQFDRSLHCFEQAMVQPGANTDSLRVMAMHWSRGRAMRALGQIENALALQQSLLADMNSN